MPGATSPPRDILAEMPDSDNMVLTPREKCQSKF